jgi:2-polyprenyl-3-methyl-5-hydroxy-6-metoxy-1,4-benzoquinol methylase
MPYHWLFDREDLYGYGTEYWGYLDIVANMVAVIHPGSVLDVGCGDGFMSDYIAKKSGAHVIGIDICERAIKFATLLTEAVEFHCAELTSLVKRGWKFDCALVIEVLEHIPTEDLAPFVRDLGRCLRPNGVLVVSVPSTLKPVLRADHIAHFTQEKIVSLLTQNSFRVEEVIFQHDTEFQRRCRYYKRLVTNRFYKITFLQRFLVNSYFQRHNLLEKGDKAGRFIVKARNGSTDR